MLDTTALKKLVEQQIEQEVTTQVQTLVNDPAWKNQFEERHAGYGNAHKVGIIEGGATFAETKVMSQRDMEFSDLINFFKPPIKVDVVITYKVICFIIISNYYSV